MKTITVIGAGLSGTLLIMNLLKQKCNGAVKIFWIDPGNENSMGFAYSTNEDYLLNVPAELMGAFSKDPENFLQWARNRNSGVNKGDYLSRKLYREYIHELLYNARSQKNENINLERIRDLSVNITINNKRAKVYLKNSGIVETDKVVLALGNSLPGNPVVTNKQYFRNDRYARNPWDPDILENISKNDTVIFIGTGQTMVDLVTGLHKKNHTGYLIAVSRRGVLPMSQKMVDPYPSFYNELKEYSSISLIFQIVRKHLKIAKEKNLDPRSVIDSLRPYTTAIWMKLPPKEKRRFLRHLFRYWEIIRSRIPPASERIINGLIISGQLKIYAGRIKDIIPLNNSIDIIVNQRNSNIEKKLSADYVINCKGPNLDYEKIEQELIKNLITNKLITCDPAHLGINALPEGPVLTHDNMPSDILYTIGPPLKGIVWESIATPEIRLQAENLSRLLFN